MFNVEDLKNPRVMYLPNTKFGVVDDVVGHGKLGLVLRWINRFDLTNNATLRLQDPTVFLGYIG